MPIQRLILIRHDKAEHLVSDRTGGWTDAHLTAFGRRQARRTGNVLIDRTHFFFHPRSITGLRYSFWGLKLVHTIIQPIWSD